MITTLRSKDGIHFHIDITVSDDGSVATTLGPFTGQLLAERCERHILCNHRAWENHLTKPDPDAYDDDDVRSSGVASMLMTEMERDTELVFDGEEPHRAWMQRFPLPYTGEHREEESKEAKD